MKKLAVLVLTGLACATLLFGCGNKDENVETVAINEVESAPATVAETETETESAVEEDVPPEEGMVRSPLTNEWISGDIADQRPIAVMIPNENAALPHYNISNADILYECNVEGNMTRLMAVFKDWESLDRIGNVRSCRDYYVYWAKEWDAIYCHIGGPFYILDIINDPTTDNITEAVLASDSSQKKGLYANAFTRVSDRKAQKGDFVLSLKKDRELGKEGYTIDIDKQVNISAPKALGVYWATRTLLQIAEQSDNRQLPQGTIRDYPDYAMRGFVIDCGRKFIPMDYLRNMVKILSYYKMNVFHIHLNDNGFKQYFNHDWDKTYAAFRLECETFPGLTARDGYYTKQQFIHFQEEAEKQFVEIIPEIDAPAHTLAFSQYKPEIGSKEYGMDHLDLSNPETYAFMDALFEEYIGGNNPVFRGPKVHIGTDEYSNKDPNVVEQFRAFTDHYINYVEKFGKQAFVWGALTHADGKTPVKSDNVGMYAWYNGYAEPKEMVKQGYKLVSIPDGLVYIVPAAGYYYDYLNTEYLYNHWTPAHVGDVVFEEKDPAILGGMFAVWNDHVGNGISVKDIHHRVFPALQTVAAKTWSSSVSVPYALFESNRKKLSEAPDVNQLARVGKGPGLVYEANEVHCGMQLPYPEIGYNYTITFDLEAAQENYGAELFRSPTQSATALSAKKFGWFQTYNIIPATPSPNKKCT